MANNVWITADLHINHKNILHHQKERIEAMGLNGAEDISGHNEYITNMFLSQTKRGDRVYLLGDVILDNQQNSKKFLDKIKSNGCSLYLIEGNHDKSIHKMYNMFESIDLIKKVIFKKNEFDFLDEDFSVIMCHYPMKSWADKCRGSMNLYGHIHANAPWVDNETNDLCLNVGLDNPLCNYKLFSLEQIYSYYKNKLNGISPSKYSDEICKIDKKYIR